MKKIIVCFFCLSGIVVTMRLLFSILAPVTILRVLGGIDTYNPNVYLCLPAAYTSIDNTIEGAYRINGKTHGLNTLKEFVSIHPTKGLIIGNRWYSNNGFQQHVLVKNNKARKFKDERKRYRRVLCHEGENATSYLIIESTYPMTLSDFSKEVSKYCYNAVNLDMGNYSYGWIGKNKHSLWSKYNQEKQTSWIVCETQ